MDEGLKEVVAFLRERGDRYLASGVEKGDNEAMKEARILLEQLGQRELASRVAEEK